MKYSELENKTIEELRKQMEGFKIKLGKLRFELANRALKDFSQINKTKKNIARILTAIKKTENSK
jgi:large subunit ribosomal protein L29